MHKLKLSLVFILAIFIFACTSDGKKTEGTIINSNEIKETEAYISLKDADISIGTKFGEPYGNFVSFDIISGSEITADDIIIDNDNVSYKITLNPIEKTELSEYSYFVYKNIDFKKLYDLEHRYQNSEITTEQYAKENEGFVEGFEDFRLKMIEKKAKYYSCTIAFDTKLKGNYKVGEPVNISSLTIKNANIDEKFDIGSIKILTLDEFETFVDQNENFTIMNVSEIGRGMIPNSNGYIEFSNLEFKCLKTCIIAAVEFVDDAVKIQENIWDISTNGSTKNIKFLKDMVIEEGSKGSIHILAKDKRFESKLDYARSYTIRFTIIENSKKSYVYYSAQLQTRPDYEELLLSHRNNLNYSSYYFDYYGKLNFEKEG